MSKFAKTTAELVIGFILFAAIGATVLAVVAWEILYGRGTLVVIVMIAVPIIGSGAFALWDRWHCKRWPQPTELPPPRVVTRQVESVERARVR